MKLLAMLAGGMMNGHRFDYTILGLIVGSLLGMALGIPFFFAQSTATVAIAVYVGALAGAGAGAVLDRVRLNQHQ